MESWAASSKLMKGLEGDPARSQELGMIPHRPPPVTVSQAYHLPSVHCCMKPLRHPEAREKPRKSSTQGLAPVSFKEPSALNLHRRIPVDFCWKTCQQNQAVSQQMEVIWLGSSLKLPRLKSALTPRLGT